MRTTSLSTIVLVACAPPSAGVAPDAATLHDAAEPMWTNLFDGTSTTGWRMSTIANQPGNDDPGRFDVEAGALVAKPGSDIGLLWYATPAPADFELVVQWRATSLDDNSGVFVRFPDLDSKGYNNTAYVAVHLGFEVQIDERGYPDGADRHLTGAIYDRADQTFVRVPARPVGAWNEYRIRVIGQVYEVFLDGVRTTRFENLDLARGVASPAFIGLQTHPEPGTIAFRDIRIRAL